MTPLFQKLNLAGGTGIVVVLNAPPEFEPELAALGGVTVHREFASAMTFAMGFARTLAELDAVSSALVRTDAPDPILWVAYPKGTSKKYRCEFNRDTGWSVLGEAGYEPVRQVAIDADWSALRFRRVERIASLTRSTAMALTAEGKRRTTR
jgi:hypothetical protein